MAHTPAKANNQELEVHADRGVWTPGQASKFTPEQRDELRALGGLDKASDGDLAMLNTVAQQTGLNPFLKELYLVGRNTNTGTRDNPRWETKWTVQTGIDGFRAISHRYADSKGLGVNISSPIFYDENGTKRPFWSKKFGDHPEAAEVTVSIGNSSATVVNSWDEYAQTTKSGQPNSMWTKMGATMLAKTAEAAAHRRVCPLSKGLYAEEEMTQADQQPVAATAERVETVRPALEQAVTATLGEDSHDDELATVLAVISGTTSKAEVDGLEAFIKDHLAKYPSDRDQIVTEWKAKKAEVS